MQTIVFSGKMQQYQVVFWHQTGAEKWPEIFALFMINLLARISYSVTSQNSNCLKEGCIPGRQSINKLIFRFKKIN